MLNEEEKPTDVTTENNYVAIKVLEAKVNIILALCGFTSLGTLVTLIAVLAELQNA